MNLNNKSIILFNRTTVFFVNDTIVMHFTVFKRNVKYIVGMHGYLIPIEMLTNHVTKHRDNQLIH